MRMSVADAKAQLTELVRRAAAGDDVILTRHGQAVVRLVPVNVVPDRTSPHALLEAVWADCGRTSLDRPPASRSEEFLYGDDGLPTTRWYL